MYKKNKNHPLLNERVIFLRKIVLVIITVICVFLVYNKVNANEIVIPDTAIRLRVIPNSNSVLDIIMKEKVKKYLENNIYELFEQAEDINSARGIINANTANITNDINTMFKDNNYDMNFEVKYGNNYFPDKEYAGITYPSGYYESLVVSIGEAKGDNFWCVLFPTFCMLDTKDKDDTEYKFFLKELIDKIK